MCRGNWRSFDKKSRCERIYRERERRDTMRLFAYTHTHAIARARVRRTLVYISSRSRAFTTLDVSFVTKPQEQSSAVSRDHGQMHIRRKERDRPCGPRAVSGRELLRQRKKKEKNMYNTYVALKNCVISDRSEGACAHTGNSGR